VDQARIDQDAVEAVGLCAILARMNGPLRRSMIAIGSATDGSGGSGENSD